MKIVTIILLLLSGQIALAQDIRLAGIEYFNYPKAPIRDGAGNYESSFQEYGAFASYPLRLKNNKTVIINGIQYALVDASVYNHSTSETNSRNFQSIAYSFSFIQNLNDKWKIVATLTPTLASDFKEKLSTDDFFMQGNLVGIKNLNDYSSLGGGITYTTRLGAPLLLPAFYFRYYKNRHKLNILLPMLADYAFRLDARDKFNAGFRMGLNGANFHVSENGFNNNVDINKLRYSRINLGPVISYKFSKMIKLEVAGVISVSRKFEFLDEQQKKYTLSSKNVAFFNIGLAIVPPSAKNN